MLALRLGRIEAAKGLFEFYEVEAPMEPKLLIVAGSYVDYNRFVLERGIDPAQAKYVSRPQDLKGWNAGDVQIVYTPLAYRNPLYWSEELAALDKKAGSK